MTGPATGEPDRSSAAPVRTSATRNTASAILILLALGFALRFIIAYILPGSGFGVDLSAFRFWAANLADHGAWGFYARDFFHDYTPGYLYALWLVGIVEKVVPSLDLIKVPAILADLVVGWLIWSMTLELGGGRRAALFAAALYLFVPVTWFDSVVWGQVDSFGTVFLLLGLRELWRDRPERATAFAVIAAIIKPQLGILAFIAAGVLLRRYLLDAPSLSDLRKGPARLASSAAVGLATAVALCAPFQQSIFDLIGQVQKTAGGYPWITVNAYNPWALITTPVVDGQGGNGLAANGQWVCDAVTGTAAGTLCPPGSEQLIGPFPAVAVGVLLMLLVITALVVAVMRRPDRLTILVALTVLAIAFFVVPTRVHERYLFPFVALAAILAAISRLWLIAYVALAIGTIANMYAVLTIPFYQNPNISDWFGIADGLRSFTGVAAVAVVATIGLVWGALQLRSSAHDALEEDLAWATEPADFDDGPDREPPTAVGRTGDARADDLAGLVRPAASFAIGSAPATGLMARAMTSPSATVGTSAAMAGSDAEISAARPPDLLKLPSFLGPLGRRLNARPLRADRSRALRAELGGKLDRLDLWLVVVLVISSFGLRLWRLDEPAAMHFDEVYHARTATEFLQDWRYGIPHSIYEYTHPHLAKYAMAAGIVAWGDDEVTSTSNLGVPVRDAAIEARWDDPTLPDHRAGDRLYVATGAEIRVYDLQTRALLDTIDDPGAAAVAVDTTNHRLFVSTAAGAVSELDTSATLDTLRTNEPASVDLTEVGTYGTGIKHLYATDDGQFLLATTTAGDVVSMDASSGEVQGHAGLSGAQEIVAAGATEVLLADTTALTDPETTALNLADILGGSTATYRSRLANGHGQVVVSGPIESQVHVTVEAAIADGRLAGLSFTQIQQVAVTDSQGVDLIAESDGQEVQAISITGDVGGLSSSSNLDAPRLFVATGNTVTVIKLHSGTDVAGAATIELTIPMPGHVDRVTFDDASVMVHVLGTTPDGKSPTIYVIEPHGYAVYADAVLPFTPAAWATDVAPDYPSADRQAILALDASGTVASVDIGDHEFSWRLPGVIAGALTAGLIFLLARILFRRRSVAIFAAILTLVDGMMFVQSRIAMNDVYVGLFLMAAYVVFGALWTGQWKWRGAFWVGMPVIGLLLGLALASKWVAAYAIAAIGLLILVRSALGRVIAIVGLIAATVVLGYGGLATATPEAGQTASSSANLLFMFIMIGLTLITVLVTVLHPIAWSREEAWFAVAAPAAAGVLAGLAGIALANRTGQTAGNTSERAISAGIGLLLLAGAVLVVFNLAARRGFGPLAPPLAMDDPARLAEAPAPAAAGWLRIGSGFGIPVVWMIGSLLVLPVAVYIVAYIPWALNSGGSAGSPLIFPAGTPIIGAWPPGHTGQTLWQLTNSMYSYHNDLRATHPAASPWWAWPLDLKPVWFYQGSFASGTSAAIYDAGNLVVWWLGVPALGFTVWQAFKRRSLGLALIAFAFAFQWLSWARIDRATFQYHYYTSVPFVILALAYFLAELWHGASNKTWLLARASAALAIMGPGLMWAAQSPICSFVGVNRAYPNSPACISNPGDFVLTQHTAALVVIAAIALVVGFLLYPLLRSDERGIGGLDGDGGPGPTLTTRAVIVGVLVVAAIGLNAIAGDGVLLNIHGFQIAPVALGAVVALGFVAFLVLGARDARRFVVGVVVAAIAEFLVFYPNIAALPLPSAIFNAYQGLLPTYLYPFQFPVNTDPPVTAPSLLAADPKFLGLPPGPVLVVFLGVTCLIVAYSAWSWRIALAERAHDEAAESDALARP